MLMADAAQQAAVAQGYNIVISVHDQHGNLKYLRRDASAGVQAYQASAPE